MNKIATTLIIAAGLGFLGLGVAPPQPGGWQTGRHDGAVITCGSR